MSIDRLAAMLLRFIQAEQLAHAVKVGHHAEAAAVDHIALPCFWVDVAPNGIFKIQQIGMISA